MHTWPAFEVTSPHRLPFLYFHARGDPSQLRYIRPFSWALPKGNELKKQELTSKSVLAYSEKSPSESRITTTVQRKDHGTIGPLPIHLKLVLIYKLCLHVLEITWPFDWWTIRATAKTGSRSSSLNRELSNKGSTCLLGATELSNDFLRLDMLMQVHLRGIQLRN